MMAGTVHVQFSDAVLIKIHKEQILSNFKCQCEKPSQHQSV